MNIIEKIKNSKSMSGIVRMLKNDKKLFNFVVNRTKYLDIDASINERLFNIKNDIFQKTQCPICSSNILEWNFKYKKYKNTCNNKKCKNMYTFLNKDLEIEKIRRKKISENQKNKSKEEKELILQKIKKTNINKYGVDSYAKTEEFKKFMKETYGYVSPFELEETHHKSKLTLIKKYGCDHNFKIDDVKKHKIKTYFNKYGVDNPAKSSKIKAKIRNTNNKKFGGNSPMTNSLIKEKSIKTYNKNYVYNKINHDKLVFKREQTMLNRYGVKYWIQDSKNKDKIIRKTKYKKYSINGKDFYLQGYEDYVLFEILLKNFDINDIFITNNQIEKSIGKIYYDYNGKKHRYYPDFFVLSENKIYEVKSKYTYESNIDINIKKQDSCINKNINFEFIIVDTKIYKDWKIKNKIKYEKI